MTENGVCGVCGKHLAQRVGTLTARHTRVDSPEQCEGYDIPAMSVQQWTEWVESPVNDWDL